MFRPRSEERRTAVVVTVEDRKIAVPVGASAAAAVLAAGFDSIRETAGGSERMPYCMMGVCFDCLAEIDDVPNRQSCMIEVRDGMRISRQIGARRIDPTAG
ncbi:MAG: (2Fe-2S)-binding protein [Alphaproteobacteria bacterium]|jgi:D-hydroxyproline dehydrogenase subunit gamma|nr:MAG: (2Fe-2S)-binding protein [Alphaproteobacteria bacterium]